MTAIVRRAISTDIDAIFSLGTKEPAFGVNERIRFYEREELVEWFASPDENLLLVIENNGDLAGFCFCKIMSFHWAYLDNFYVSPTSRGQGYGHLLMQALLDLIRERKIAYLTTLVAESDTFLTAFFGKCGLVTEKTYVWQDRFVE